MNELSINKKPSLKEINDACLFFRHDYGLLNSEEQKNLRFEAQEWLSAWKKSLLKT